VSWASIERARARSVERLLAERDAQGVWVGELSSSALSTATAVLALALRARELEAAEAAVLVDLALGGARWLATHQNADGGWGDSADSPSNISTTTLVWAALGALPAPLDEHADTLARAEERMRAEVGELSALRIARGIETVYGDDRTFAVPILMACALSGRFGDGCEAWRTVTRLPFELAALPHQLFRWLGLPMVSYALPALIAVGQVIHHQGGTWNPLTRCLREQARARTLRVLESIQPENGGFLEATPLTSFVTMSLIGAGQGDHVVVERGLRFLRESVREDGSWPIDTNLTTWVTTLALKALDGGGRLEEHLGVDERSRVRAWLLAQQYEEEHPYTHAAPGGWAWTDLPGGVPDADDTPGALLALRALDPENAAGSARAAAACRWMVELANRDGGMPTFCRGWGKLPFDQSCPDLTAHALSAWAAWGEALDPALARRVGRARERALRHLLSTQRADGSWVPLWFGNQRAPGQENPLYGTSRVIVARPGAPPGRLADEWAHARSRAASWILAAQHADGGWGGAPLVHPTIEETALAVEALAELALDDPAERERLEAPIERGAAWLARATEEGEHFPASPIGLYFAKLWYSERLYPIVFTTAALERASRVLAPTPSALATP